MNFPDIFEFSETFSEILKNNIDNAIFELINGKEIVSVDFKLDLNKGIITITKKGADLTHEIDKSAAVQMSERVSSKRHNVVCPYCGFEMPIITMKENAVCRGLEMRCKNQACKQLFEIKINTDKIK